MQSAMLNGFSDAKPRMTALLAWVLLTIVQPADGAVFKCAAEGGGIVYQDSPCQPGKELRNFDTDPANLSVVPGTPEIRLAPAAKAGPPSNAGKRATKERVLDTKAAARRFAQIG